MLTWQIAAVVLFVVLILWGVIKEVSDKKKLLEKKHETRQDD
jgi:hypothetical protein